MRSSFLAIFSWKKLHRRLMLVMIHNISSCTDSLILRKFAMPGSHSRRSMYHETIKNLYLIPSIGLDCRCWASWKIRKSFTEIAGSSYVESENQQILTSQEWIASLRGGRFWKRNSFHLLKGKSQKETPTTTCLRECEIIPFSFWFGNHLIWKW